MKLGEITISPPRPLDEIMALGQVIIRFKTKEMELEFCRFMQNMTTAPLIAKFKEPKMKNQIDILRGCRNQASIDFALFADGDINLQISHFNEDIVDIYIYKSDVPRLIKSLKELIIMLGGE